MFAKVGFQHVSLIKNDKKCGQSMISCYQFINAKLDNTLF